MSLIFVQLPGISLALLGILKAFMNHGPSKDAAVDSLRYLLDEKMVHFSSSIICTSNLPDPASCSVFLSSLLNFLASYISFCQAELKFAAH